MLYYAPGGNGRDVLSSDLLGLLSFDLPRLVCGYSRILLISWLSDALGEIFGDVPGPTDIRVTRWGSDSRSLGAYSYMKVLFSASFQALRPISPT